MNFLDAVAKLVDDMDLTMPPGASWGIDQDGIWAQPLSGSKLRGADAEAKINSWKRKPDGE